MFADSFVFRRGRLGLLDENGDVLAVYETPSPDGIFEIDRHGDATAITAAEIPAATGTVVTVEGGRPYGIRLPTFDFHPMRAVTRAEINAFVDGLTAAQTRRALAWVIYQLRDQIPEDVRDRIS